MKLKGSLFQKFLIVVKGQISYLGYLAVIMDKYMAL